MDIAKIRKKIKEAKTEEYSRHKEEDIAQKPADKPVDDASEGARQQPAVSEKAGAGEQKPEPGIEKPEVVPQPNETAKEKSPVLPGQTESVSKAVKPEDLISGIIELLTFQLAAEEFAFRISDVEEILATQHITRVPKVPDYILGITSVRGKVMPVLDLKKRLLIKDNGSSGKSRKKILTMKGPNGRIGAMIDKINGVIRIDEADIAEPPAHFTESDRMFVEGVVLYNSRFISVIRLAEAANINLK